MINYIDDSHDFETLWRKMSIKICQTIYVQSEVQALKANLQKKGFLSPEEKSKFIEICNKVKYEIIQADYGPEGSEGYEKFSQAWKDWFQQKGVGSTKNHNQRNSVDHIMLGSTPVPEKFLLHFEHEILGSIKEN